MNLKSVGLGLLDTIVKGVFIVVIAMLIAKYAKVAYNYGYQIFNQSPVSSGTGRTVSVSVVEGESASSIAEKLSGAGLITDKTLFRLQERFSEYHGMVQAGTYELSTSMTPEEMLAIISGGRKSSDEDAAAEDGQESVVPTAEDTSAQDQLPEPQEGLDQQTGEESNGD
jgi:UPF0755 protein